MSSSGSGTSRRSHTKSRKGCKTCKRRHIRCDENFPQCRNCTKHQVRCDYQDATADEPRGSGASLHGLGSPSEEDELIRQWQHTGVASLGSLSINFRAMGFESLTELRVLYHVLQLDQSPEINKFRIWTNTSTQTLPYAQENAFLMHALFAFVAFGLAFEHSSVDYKSHAYNWGGLALKGIQDAIEHFSQSNADAVLLASLLLSWQANDWRSWTTLTRTTRQVVNQMQSFQDQSSLPHIIEEEDAGIPHDFPEVTTSTYSDDFYSNYVSVLQECLMSLDNMTGYLYGRSRESHYIEQLRDYVRRLLGVRPAQSPEDQFKHLYAFRKWLFWVPSILLRSRERDFMTLVVIAYFYAVALRLDPLFPDLGQVFCSRLVVRPLEEIFAEFDRAHTGSAAASQDPNMQTHLSLLAFARQAYASYHTRQDEKRAARMSMRIVPQSLEGFRQQLGYALDMPGGIHGQRSPGFGPMSTRAATNHRSSSGGSAAFLEVPVTSDSSQGTFGGYHMAVPGATLSMEPEELRYGDSNGDFSGGFVTPHTSRLLWT